MKQQQCDLEAICRVNRPTAFDKDGDCTTCVQGVMEYCDLREPLDCGHARAYLAEHEPYLGTTRLWYCAKCIEATDRRDRVENLATIPPVCQEGDPK